MSAPSSALNDSATRVVLAVAGSQHPTVRGVAYDTGVSLSAVHAILVRLRRLGLVAWEDGRQGTLRACVHPVAFGAVEVVA